MNTLITHFCKNPLQDQDADPQSDLHVSPCMLIPHATLRYPTPRDIYIHILSTHHQTFQCTSPQPLPTSYTPPTPPSLSLQTTHPLPTAPLIKCACATFAPTLRFP